ncbi:hypothetical protein K501DRAFT_265034 [Backusella circina FSU 941]|nr:hypothetical protein K501DRAFT_265034 [Backusella circina FSU 941]
MYLDHEGRKKKQVKGQQKLTNYFTAERKVPPTELPPTIAFTSPSSTPPLLPPLPTTALSSEFEFRHPFFPLRQSLLHRTGSHVYSEFSENASENAAQEVDDKRKMREWWSKKMRIVQEKFEKKTSNQYADVRIIVFGTFDDQLVDSLDIHNKQSCLTDASIAMLY